VKYREYYTAESMPELVEFGCAQFLTIMGKGAPGSNEFTNKMEVLYSVAYAVKTFYKKQASDFVVPKLEGLWWVEFEKPVFEVSRDEWFWKLLIRMPEFVTSETVEKAKVEIMKKRNRELIKEVRFEEMIEGECVQIMHVGPYSTEPESLLKIRELMEENDLVENGPHHEIYLSDPRRVPVEQIKTILRQPVRKRA
jgi:hypothetical protein